MIAELSQLHYHSLKLWYLVQHSVSSFNQLVEYFGSAEQATTPAALARWGNLKLHANHSKRAQEFYSATGQAEFEQLTQRVLASCDFILVPEDILYPQQLHPYTDKPPILFGQGSAQALSQPQIAIVGSRKPSPHGRQVAYDFAYYLSEKGFYITSGLALGIDEAAHQGALQHQRTIAVVGTGLDLVYPAHNRKLQEQILQYGGTIVSEFLPGTQPLKHHFPRRNRIVSGLSLGVLVAEAALESGSLITAQRAADQGKIIFAIPGHIYSEHHQGCHQLIREGAILVDHPEQLIEDLALPTQWHSKQQKVSSVPEPAQVPEHLFKLYQQLDWVGLDLDQIALKLPLPAAELTGHLMELELLGLCVQQSGRYLRCRPGF